jgi:hypothetical protein
MRHVPFVRKAPEGAGMASGAKVQAASSLRDAMLVPFIASASTAVS